MTNFESILAEAGEAGEAGFGGGVESYAARVRADLGAAFRMTVERKRSGVYYAAVILDAEEIGHGIADSPDYAARLAYLDAAEVIG